ncbi:GNAT family N-acetyltransferase [Crocosphaera sp.]|uniref:GNAT family N-acetyltransferase n=1 Tax=Crocosphaera sp. TaxID=2729996 RepID=UPI002635B870|nr:GNAT family N-acetyltransferase [Crocosphaera sp.]MDJ0580121.1 GNAT family N-acetyltransferase [Crocosphaera sp.]
MNHVVFRPACPDDALEVAKLAILAGGGIFEFLLEDFVKDISLENLVALEVKKETGNLSYIQTEVAELNGKIIGSLKSTDANQEDITKEEKDFLPSEKLDWLKNLFSDRTKEGYYINSLAVNSNYRKQGIGKKLIDNVKDKAKQNNDSFLTLHVWSDNVRAIKFYENQGFKAVKQLDIDFHPLMPHYGGMQLMQCMLTK